MISSKKKNSKSSASSASSTISAIIPVFNNEATIKECILSLQKQSIPFKEIIVVDDGSKDNTVSISKKLGAKVFQIKPVGRSGARNFGAKKAKSEIIAFIESDSVYSSNWVGEVYKKFSKGARAVIDRRAVLNPETFIAKMNDAIFTARYKNYSPMNAWAFQRKLFLDLNGFDESLDHGEDVELGNRLKKRGIQIVLADQAFQFHAGEPKSLEEGMQRSFSFGKNMISYYNKYPEKFPKAKIAFFSFLPFSLLFYPLFVLMIAFAYARVFFRFLPSNIDIKYVAVYPFYVILTEFVFTLGFWKARVFGKQKQRESK